MIAAGGLQPDVATAEILDQVLAMQVLAVHQHDDQHRGSEKPSQMQPPRRRAGERKHGKHAGTANQAADHHLRQGMGAQIDARQAAPAATPSRRPHRSDG